MSAPEILDTALETSPMYFAEVKLGLRNLYDWQATVLEWFDPPDMRTVRGSLATPNGAGKAWVIISSLVLWWLAMHKRGKVVITTKDSKQLDGQVQPALKRHQGKFEGWTFNDREIKTPTGGRCIMFTTDEAGRAEGWHKDDDLDGPLLIIVDEAKSVPEDIFDALDRCTYNALLYTSSPGLMAGTFYQSQVRTDLGFQKMRVGLTDCPHIPKDRIDHVIAKHGPDSPLTRSTLYGEFMVADERSVFDAAGMKRLQELAKNAKPQHGTLIRNQQGIVFIPDPDGWLTVWEPPSVGKAYLGSLDTCRHEQAKAAKDPDQHSYWMLRKAYLDHVQKVVNHRMAARIRPPCRWGAAFLAEKIALVHAWYGNPMVVPEANQGLDVINELRRLMVPMYIRRPFDRNNPGKTVEILGWETTSKSRPILVDAIVNVVREQAIDIECPHAVDQMLSFVRNELGKACALTGCHDDDCISIGIAMACIESASVLTPRTPDQWLPEWMQRQQGGSDEGNRACL